MKRAEVRSFWPDVERLRADGWDGSDFEFVVHADVGLEGEAGVDFFQFHVIGVGRLAAKVAASGPMAGVVGVVVDDFDLPAIRRVLERACGACTGADWPEVRRKLLFLGTGTFEDGLLRG